MLARLSIACAVAYLSIYTLEAPLRFVLYLVGKDWAILARDLLVFGPLALIVGVLPRITGVALSGFAALTAVLLHAFWQFSGPAAAAERTLMLADSASRAAS